MHGLQKPTAALSHQPSAVTATPPNGGGKHLQDELTDHFTALFAVAIMKEMFEFPPDISKRQEMPLFCQLIFAQMHDAGGQIHGCGTSTTL